MIPHRSSPDIPGELELMARLTVRVPGRIEKTLSKNLEQRNHASSKRVQEDPSSAMAWFSEVATT